MDLAISPDLSRLVAVGMHQLPPMATGNETGLHSARDPSSGDVSTPPALPPAPLIPPPQQPHDHHDASGAAGAAAGTNPRENAEHRMIVYDYATGRVES
jgi:hypothetical protein